MTSLYCPACGKPLDSIAWGSEDDSEPEEGFIAVCVQCATILLFKGSCFQPMTEDELAWLPQETIRALKGAQVLAGKIQDEEGGTQ